MFVCFLQCQVLCHTLQVCVFPVHQPFVIFSSICLAKGKKGGEGTVFTHNQRIWPSSIPPLLWGDRHKNTGCVLYEKFIPVPKRFIATFDEVPGKKLAAKFCTSCSVWKHNRNILCASFFQMLLDNTFQVVRKGYVHGILKH